MILREVQHVFRKKIYNIHTSPYLTTYRQIIRWKLAAPLLWLRYHEVLEPLWSMSKYGASSCRLFTKNHAIFSLSWNIHSSCHVAFLSIHYVWVDHMHQSTSNQTTLRYNVITAYILRLILPSALLYIGHPPRIEQITIEVHSVKGTMWWDRYIIHVYTTIYSLSHIREGTSIARLYPLWWRPERKPMAGCEDLFERRLSIDHQVIKKYYSHDQVSNIIINLKKKFQGYLEFSEFSTYQYSSIRTRKYSKIHRGECECLVACIVGYAIYLQDTILLHINACNFRGSNWCFWSDSFYGIFTNQYIAPWYIVQTSKICACRSFMVSECYKYRRNLKNTDFLSDMIRLASNTLMCRHQYRDTNV